MNREIRSNIRQALHDELAIIRVVNSALRTVVTPSTRRELETVRADALTVTRRLLAQLHTRKEKPNEQA